MTDSRYINVNILNNLIVGRVEPQIYAFSTQTIPNYLKVGDTYRPIETRLNEWRKYFPNLEKKFENIAKVDNETFFRDFAVHFFLENDLKRSRLKPNALKNIPYYSNEFFENATENDLKAAIEDILKAHQNNDTKYQYYRFDESPIPLTHTYTRTENYPLRPNQQQTVDNFRKAIHQGRTNLLMYAVMRFGKSFTSMCCAVEMNAQLVLVVSAKADVKEEWKKTVESHQKFEGFCFLDSSSLLSNNAIIIEKQKANEKIVIFLTLQDLQGDTIKSKHKEIFENKIDLLLIDETHFGARASEYGKVLNENKIKAKDLINELKLNDISIDDFKEISKELKAKIRIHLSGTPYRILMNSEFTNDDIIAFYQFTNIAEDQKKWDLDNLNKDHIKEWDNPYYGFPQMIRFAFNPNESSQKKMEELKKQGITYAFSELLKPQSISIDKAKNLHKKFVHPQEILDLLKVIDGTATDANILSFLDYDKIKEGKMCRHIVCVLPFRASCDAMQDLIQNNSFKHLSQYQIINISGVELDKSLKDTQAIQAKIKKCESENIKTITLTVNRMLTGSTVPEWDTMLYLKDTASPQEYDQAIFRLQNQYIKVLTEPNGDVVKFNMKPQTLLVDFNPNRMFVMQEEKAQIYNANTEKDGNLKLIERLNRELEVSPIIHINKDKLVQVNPTDILNAVREYSSNRSVLDEAKQIPLDFSLLNIDAIRQEIERQNEIGSNDGLKIKPHQKPGDGDEINFPPVPPETDKPGGDTKPTIETQKTEENDTNEASLRKKFASYYSRILFFAFCTQAKIISLQEIIDLIEKDKESKRIAANLDLNIEILKLLRSNLQYYILSKLEYKIQNINSLANDTSLAPIERASRAMKKFTRLSESEIVTPDTVADKIIDSLPANAITKNTKILDIASKQGEFVYAVYKKYGKSIANKFYSIPTSKIAYEFTRKVYKLLELDMELIEEHYTSYDLIKENDYVEKDTMKINGKKLKFDVIVGNPPYQLKGGSGGNNDAPIFQIFSEIANNLSQINSLIMPSRWFTSGRENLLSDFRNKMLNNIKIQRLEVYSDSNDLFTGIDLKGGTCILMINKSYDGLCNYIYNSNGKISESQINLNTFEILVRDPKLSVIIEKLEKNRISKKYKTVDLIVSSDTPFKIPSNPKESKKTPFDVYSFSNEEHNTLLYHIENGKRKIEYVKISDIVKNKEDVDKHKVFLTGSGGSGIDSKVLGYPEYAPKNSVCSQSYLYSAFETENEAKNFIKYIKTKFLRILVSAIKITQSASNKVYKFVPLQNFTSESDIDWSKSISEIDKQLYKKYELTDQEIAFIEEMIKQM